MKLHEEPTNQRNQRKKSVKHTEINEGSGKRDTKSKE